MGLRELILDLRKLNFGLKGLSFEPVRTDFGPERANFGSERTDLEPKGPRGDGCTDVWKFTPMTYCPKSV